MRALVLWPCALFACGSENRAPTVADVDAIEASALSMMATARTAEPPNVDVTVACPFSGAVRTHGDCAMDDGRRKMTLVIEWSGDCAVADNLVVDGALDLSLADEDAAMTGRLGGTVAVYRRSPTGGLSRVDDCLVSLAVADTVSGSICGRPVRARW